MENKMKIGILGIILGILILIFPYMSQFVLSIIFGIGIIIFGIYLLVMATHSWPFSKLSAVIYLILGILSLIAGIMLLGNLLLFKILISFYLYIVGFMLLFAGITGLFIRSALITKSGAGLMALLGIITIILGYFALLGPIFVSIILGLSLIIDGISITIGNNNFIE